MQERLGNPDEPGKPAALEELSSLEVSPQAHEGLPPSQTINPSNHQTFFYTQDEDEDVPENDGPHGLSSPLVMPFQPSTPLPVMPQPVAGTIPAPSGGFPASPVSKAPVGRGFPLAKVLVLVGMVALTLAVGSLVVFAQPAPSVPAQHTQQLSRAVTAPPSPGGRPQVTPSPSFQGQPSMGTSTPVGLPPPSTLDQLGWTSTGLSPSDAIEAQRTAMTFVDREMSYDYRNIGTLAHHRGTFTAALFLLTSGGQVRFAQQDVRLINNVLYLQVRDNQRIQQVLNPQPTLAHLEQRQVQGRKQMFVWVTVSFTLFQSQLDAATGHRVEGIEQEQGTQQPRRHQMSVVLVRVPPEQQDQGAGAPMGGTGWLVNTYALDATTLPAIATSPTI